MLRLVVIASLLGLAQSATLHGSKAGSGGWCYGYLTETTWCYLTLHGGKHFTKEGDGGYSCSDYDSYSSNDYCEDAAGGNPKIHGSAQSGSSGSSASSSGSSASSSGSAGSSGSPWATYLASLTGKTNLDWKAACKSLGQQPAGYGMGSGGGVTSYHLTCNNNKITVKCHGNPFTSCESDYSPPATISDSPPTGDYNKVASAGDCGGLTQAEVQEFLNIHNKMRCAVGAPPVEWDAALQCQAQRAQNRIGQFKHSDCYNLPIKAGENIATGTNVATAAWMWFLEYLQSTDYENGGETGHFSAMSWKGVHKIGCGIGRNGKGVIRCQYVGDPLPNMAGSYDSNLDPFYGIPADFAKCKMPIAEIKSQAKMQQSWNILNPSGQMASNLGLYSITDSIWPHASSMAFFSACAFLGTAAMVSLGVAMRRWNGKARDVNTEEHLELASIEDADGLE